ncbi:UDP-glucose 4-epimerase [Novimethylophilus kurashikiensis]|uniref:UDP-glucose 4-epimerase n=1 Tax=Novimethylophilus kurashikiensis TaxID=1825523 RepID=A0A2R5FEQ9_9PROT|nr:UDP-glucose 4-epimerase GalE [Novimethylophilus kurashikiensis]GBG14971.1 UDP-glucose 4-epimerase [Novimethylophilus kurashikiensis]
MASVRAPILVTGGTGYIGSHTVVELMAAGRDVFIIDNYCNSKPSVLDRIEQIAGRRPGFLQLDLRDRAGLQALFSAQPFDAVVHFSGLKAVGESVSQSLKYYDNNVAGSVILFNAMAEAGIKKLVFSSSATVYGDPHSVPIREDFPLSATNPYGRSKLMIEDILRDASVSDQDWRIGILRYFNPVGAHESGLIGEDPNGIPNNLMPYIAQVAVGKLQQLAVFGDDYPTPDGTGVRDYIHVVDLAQGHVAALDVLDNRHGLFTVNLGTGHGYSVLEMVQAFSRASGHEIPYRIAPRRPGDIAQCYADPSLAQQLLGWQATRGIDQMCSDVWHWQSHEAQTAQ